MIVITGASDGLGKALAKLYKEAGKKVVNISRRECEHADENICLDLREGSEIKKAAKAVAAIDDKLEAIVYCAGVVSIQPFGEIEESEVKRLLSTNVTSQILLTSELYSRVLHDNTDVVCVSSTVGVVKEKSGRAVYGASKAAVRAFAKNLQTELVDTQSRVISFVPGGFVSRTVEKFTGEEFRNPETLMKPEDVAGLIKSILELPKNMEVSEIVVNKKVHKK